MMFLTDKMKLIVRAKLLLIEEVFLFVHFYLPNRCSFR